MAIGFGGWLIIPVSAAIWHGHKPPPSAVFVAFGVFFGAAIALMFFVRCPKCGAALGQLTNEFGFQWLQRGKSRQIKFCPYCGVSMDEPMPEAPAATSEDVTTPDKLTWK